MEILGSVNTDWVSDNYLLRNLVGSIKKMLGDRITLIAFLFLAFMMLLAIIGPIVAPYDHSENLTDENGQLLRSQSPSLEHPLGTTFEGKDVLSRVLQGARPTLAAGFLGGTLIIALGLTVSLTAGYVGGKVDSALMRFTDLVYGIPLIPFAIVLIAFLEPGFFTTVAAIGLILWRGSARVIRSQVLQIRERPFILAAQATGASTPRIIVRHILPNIAPMAVLFYALGIGFTILIQAGLVFLGLTDPFIPTWGVMIRNVYNSGMIADLWWWSIPPGLLITGTVLSAFLLGRGYERISSGDDRSSQTVSMEG
jgi:peptide/nickel transport system permease protein